MSKSDLHPEVTSAQADRAALVEWVESRMRSPWAPGWSDDFKLGYDTAVYEVAARLGIDYKPFPHDR